METEDPADGSDGTIICVENLEHAYGNFRAVDGISFAVRRGEIFSFLGPNGAGKSTAINVLITLLALQKGRATIAGYDVTKEPQKVRESIGIVFQDITLDRDMTVWELLEFHGRLYTMPTGERRRRIDELLKLVQLEPKRNELTKRLSGGMKRRLEIARGLMTRPKVLFLDEPFSALDYEMTLFIRDKLQEIYLKTGVTMVIVSHNLEDAVFLSDKILLLTRRPTRIAEYMPFAMARPRDPASMSDPDFVTTKAHALEVFQREVRA